MKLEIGVFLSLGAALFCIHRSRVFLQKRKARRENETLRSTTTLLENTLSDLCCCKELIIELAAYEFLEVVEEQSLRMEFCVYSLQRDPGLLRDKVELYRFLRSVAHNRRMVTGIKESLLRRKQSKTERGCYFCTFPLIGSHEFATVSLKYKKRRIESCLQCHSFLKHHKSARILHFKSAKSDCHWSQHPMPAPTVKFWNLNRFH